MIIANPENEDAIGDGTVAGPSHATGPMRERYISQGLPTKPVADITIGEHCKVEGTVYGKSFIIAGKSDKGSYTYFFFEQEDASGVLKVSAYDKFANEFFDRIMVNFEFIDIFCLIQRFV